MRARREQRAITLSFPGWEGGRKKTLASTGLARSRFNPRRNCRLNRSVTLITQEAAGGKKRRKTKFPENPIWRAESPSPSVVERENKSPESSVRLIFSPHRLCFLQEWYYSTYTLLTWTLEEMSHFKVSRNKCSFSCTKENKFNFLPSSHCTCLKKHLQCLLTIKMIYIPLSLFSSAALAKESPSLVNQPFSSFYCFCSVFACAGSSPCSATAASSSSSRSLGRSLARLPARRQYGMRFRLLRATAACGRTCPLAGDLPFLAGQSSEASIRAFAGEEAGKAASSLPRASYYKKQVARARGDKRRVRLNSLNVSSSYHFAAGRLN